MKGITPVIAVILLLLITVAMVGFAFVWFTQITRSTTDIVGKDVNSTIVRQAQKISIDNVNNITRIITIRNIGSQPISLASGSSEVAVFIATNATTGLSPATFTGAPNTLQPGQYATCSGAWTGPDCWGAVGTVKITAPGNFDQRNC